MILLGWGLWAGCGTSAPTPCEAPGTQVAEVRAAGCFVMRGDALLMVQNAAGDWSIPGGFVEAGESSAQAAVRETREEAGIEVTAGPPRCAVASKGFVAHTCTVADPRALPRADGDETTAVQFVTASALKSLPLRFPDQREAYLRAVSP